MCVGGGRGRWMSETEPGGVGGDRQLRPLSASGGDYISLSVIDLP